MHISRKHLVAAARGDEPVDLVIRKANLVNVFTAEVYPADIGIKGDRFACVARYKGDNPIFDIEGHTEVDAAGKYATPGLFDAHVHIESTMVPPDMFARAVLRRGTTTAVIDPHEIANVLGAEGVRYMVEASRGLPLRVLTTVPSCVPAVVGLETAGAEFEASDIEELLGLDGVIGIAELMDYPGVIDQNPRMASIVETGLKKGVFNEGHAPRVSERRLQAYLASGVDSDHESRDGEEILEKLRAGMTIYIRESSVSKFAGAAADAWRQAPHTVNLAMCTDDVEPDDLLRNGHMDRVVHRCVESGMPAPLAVRYASLGGASRYGMGDLGAIAPGYKADLVLADSLENLEVRDVYSDGECVVSDGELIVEVAGSMQPILRNTVIVPRLEEEDFTINIPTGEGKVTLTTIEMTETGTTVSGTVEVEARDGLVSELPPGYIFVSVVGRHGQSVKPFVGILAGSGLSRGAYATTVAHDSHNLVVAGTNAADMLLATQTLASCGGGLCLTDEGKVVALIELKVAGLMSPEPVEELAPKVQDFNACAEQMGLSVGRRSAAMALSSLTLTVIPEIRISDKGLVDVDEQKIIALSE